MQNFKLTMVSTGVAAFWAFASTPAAAQGCSAMGTWSNSLAGVGSSTWTIDASGNAYERGFGNSTGRAAVVGHRLTIAWGGGGYEGTYSIDLDASCNNGNGQVVQTRAPVGQRPRTYRASFTRVGACLVGGRWQNSVPGLGTSFWNIDANGNATERGMANATGRASVSGRHLSIVWTTANGFAGTYSIDLNAACTAGTGELVQTRAPAGSRPNRYRSTFTR